MKTRLAFIAILLTSLTIVHAGPKQSSGYPALIVGQWKIDANPPRFPKFNSDGTWTLMYLGSSNVQTGTWRIKGNILERTYTSGGQRESEIIRLDRSEMILRNKGQLDTYQRITAVSSRTGPVKVAQ